MLFSRLIFARLNKSKAREEEWKAKARSQIEKDELRLREMNEQRRKDQMILKAQKDMDLQLKKDNLERIRRAQMYKQRQQMEKAEASDKKCRELQRRKEELLKIRKQNASAAKIKKDRLLEVLEKSKSGGSSGIKKLLKLVSSEDPANDSSPNGRKLIDDNTGKTFLEEGSTVEDEQASPIAPNKSFPRSIRFEDSTS